MKKFKKTTIIDKSIKKILLSRFLYPTLIFIIIYIVFSPSLYKGFASWDDKWMIYDNPQVFDLSFNGVFNTLGQFYTGQYSPLNTFAYALIVKAFGVNPFFFHMFCILLHITNVILVFQLCKRLLTSLTTLRFIEGIKLNQLDAMCFLIAILFGIHPMQVESVAWISASKILMYSTLYLTALIFYLKYLERNLTKYYLISFASFILSFGAKEQTVVLPFALVLLDYLFHRDFLSKRFIIEKIPFFIAAILLGFVAIYAQDKEFHNKLNEDYYPIGQRLFLSNFALNEYFFKVLFPINLMKFYPFPSQPGEPLPIKYVYYSALCATWLVLFWKFSKDDLRYVVFGLSFMLINLILSIHLVPMARSAFMADRYIYLSSVGVFFVIVVTFFKIRNAMMGVFVKPFFSFSFIFYVACLTAYTAYYTYHWM